MKRHGILNSHISKILSDLGHTDQIVIADAGLPIPDGVLRIDLSLKLGTPSFKEVVSAIAEDMVIEKMVIADEMETNNLAIYQFINNLISQHHFLPSTHVLHHYEAQSSHPIALDWHQKLYGYFSWRSPPYSLLFKK